MVFLILLIAYIITAFFIARWLFNDAEKRGENGTKWVIYAFLGGPIVLLIWLMGRPSVKTKKEDLEWEKKRKHFSYKFKDCPECGENSFEIEEDRSATCHECGYSVSNVDTVLNHE